MRPRDRVGLALERWGRHEVLRRIGAALRLRPDEPADPDAFELAVFLGGHQRDSSWQSADAPPGHLYWARVWATRALLYEWDEGLRDDVVLAVSDEHWRVREKALAVVAVREVGCADLLGPLVSDDVPRVRTAAARALGAVGEAEHGDWLHQLAEDSDPAVAAAADRAFEQLTRRVDSGLSHH
jgi:HEAT repeat protein